MNTLIEKKQEEVYFLSDLVGAKVFADDKKIGKLGDMAIREDEKLPRVTHLVVNRPFGHKPLLIPWDRVEGLNPGGTVVHLESIAAYEGEPDESQVLLNDHILDKKVIDMDDKEIDVVYDIKLVLRNEVLYVTDVDFSRYALFKRLGLLPVMKLLFGGSNILKKETLSWAYVQPLPENIGRFKGYVKLNVLKEKLTDIHPVDLADILEDLGDEQRLALFEGLDTEHASDTLEEIEPRVQRTLISSMDKGRVADLIDEMTPAQAADVLSVLPEQDKEEIMKLMEHEESKKIESILETQDDTIANLTTASFIKFGPDMTIGEAIEAYRQTAPDTDYASIIYVVSSEERLLGVLNLHELLTARDMEKLSDIMNTQVISLAPGDTLAWATERFLRYGFRALPVTSENDMIVGVVPYRDIINLKH